MATLTAYKFDTPEGAGKMLDLVQDLSKQELIEIQDAATVTWPEGKKKPKTKDLGDLTGPGALGGAFWGMLFGLLFFVPFFGMAVGAAVGALVGHYSDYGIDKDFMDQVSAQVTEGTSALFLLTGKVVMDKVSDAVKQSGLKFEIISTNLSDEQEAKLKEDFGA
ncbi:MAG: hypothetical protein AMJ56_03710 [Anaerolineae bacterium SG8_19]|jgi:uncharacterized membrane protein|nr:MAG: hypothetical protein AMJ56_03710 [Anaerolineae bacterium SG8_19]